jgi:hypothetical protein
MTQTMYLDWRGNEFAVGAIVLYPVRTSSSVTLVEAMIDSIEPVEYKTNFGTKRRNFTLIVKPLVENSNGRGFIRDKNKTVRLVAVEKVTVLND